MKKRLNPSNKALKLADKKQRKNRETERLIVISPYYSSESKHVSGVEVFVDTMFVKNKLPKYKIILLNNIESKTIKKKGWLEQYKVWSKRNFFSIFKALRFIKHNDKVVVNFDFTAFGGIANLLIFPFFYILLRFRTPNIYHVQHSVLLDLKRFAGHIGIAPSSPRQFIYSSALKLYLIFFAKISKRVVVLEEFLRQRYLKLPLVQPKDVVYIPLVLDNLGKFCPRPQTQTFEKHEKETLRVLFFGYIVWYKGIDVLLDAVDLLPKNIEVIIAGGKSPNDRVSYFEKILPKIKSSRVKYIGYVKDQDIPCLFEQADLVIFPYKELPSSSGPLAQAIYYQRPFLISEVMKDYLIGYDFKKALKKSNLSEEDIYFQLKSQALARLLIRYSEDKNAYERLIVFVKELSKSRKVSRVQARFLKVLS